MVQRTWLPALVALALLGACEARIGREGEEAEAPAADAAGAEAKAEEGTFSIEAPGFGMKLDIPSSIIKNSEIDSDSGILYPGAKLSGLHIEASDRGSSSGSGVELRFTTPDAPEKVAAWYRDPARAADFALGQVGREGDAILIDGTDKGDGDPFTLRVTPGAGGGSEGRLTLRDRS